MSTHTAVDLLTVDRQGANGVVWSLPRGSDLDANLVHLAANTAVGAHVNEEVDVLLIGVDGAGSVTVDNAEHELRSGTVVAVPKHTRRHIAAGTTSELLYLTVHLTRPRLHIQPNPTTRQQSAQEER
jgi:mannose-6-phosphate isomerase-like protein (cupin superfamily)